MLIELKTNNCKINDYNKRINECREKYPDFTLKEISGVEDKFCPYVDFRHDYGWNKYNMLQADTRNDSEFTGIYVTSLNGNYDIENLTEWKAVRDWDSPICWCSYGVCDNGTQVLEYYEKLFKEYNDYMSKNNFVILLTPIFKKNQPEYGGWRWHKWGQYIGVFNHQCEYLYDEQGIDYVYVFDIVCVQKDV